jgi:hypothetical protein
MTAGPDLHADTGGMMELVAEGGLRAGAGRTIK